MISYPLLASVRAALDQPVFPGKVIVWLLFMLSIIAWVLLLSKAGQLRRIKRSDRLFTDRLRKSKTTLEAVIQARNAATAAREQADTGNPGSIQQLASAESGLGGVLGRLFALSESYPELRSNQNMLQLQEELTSTESKVAFARQSYNDAVMHYNNKLEMFPTNFIAGMFNFVPATSFEVSSDAERESVQVKF